MFCSVSLSKSDTVCVYQLFYDRTFKTSWKMDLKQVCFGGKKVLKPMHLRGFPKVHENLYYEKKILGKDFKHFWSKMHLLFYLYFFQQLSEVFLNL